MCRSLRGTRRATASTSAAGSTCRTTRPSRWRRSAATACAISIHLLDCLDRWTVVITGHLPPASLPAGVRYVDEAAIYDGDLRYEDLVHAVDVVVTKPGYGIVAECLANGTAMLYTSRGRFREYDVMVAEMPAFCAASSSTWSRCSPAAGAGARWTAASAAPTRPSADRRRRGCCGDDSCLGLSRRTTAADPLRRAHGKPRRTRRTRRTRSRITQRVARRGLSGGRRGRLFAF